jgi:hypothetical protein
MNTICCVHQEKMTKSTRYSCLGGTSPRRGRKMPENRRRRSGMAGIMRLECPTRTYPEGIKGLSPGVLNPGQIPTKPRPHKAHQNRPRARARKAGLGWRIVGCTAPSPNCTRIAGLAVLKGRQIFVLRNARYLVAYIQSTAPTGRTAF